jgi:hypothetical protein
MFYGYLSNTKETLYSLPSLLKWNQALTTTKRLKSLNDLANKGGRFYG